MAGVPLTAVEMNLLPAGRVGAATVNSDQTGITTTAALTGFSITFTALALRRYELHFIFAASQVTSTGSQVFNWTLGGVHQAIIERAASVGVGNRTVSGFTELGVLGAGSKTVALTGSTSAGTLTIGSSSLLIGRMSIIDVGV